MGLRNVDSDVTFSHLRARPLFLNQWRTRSRPIRVMRGSNTVWREIDPPDRFLAFLRVKTAVDQTHSRSFKTKEDTIRPPPLPAMNGVVGSGFLLPREPWKSIRQGGSENSPGDCFPDERDPDLPDHESVVWHGAAAVDQTHSRSFKTKEDTIRPPPLPAINGVAGSGSLLPPGTHPNP